MLRRLSDWLDNRTGYRALLHHALDEPVPGGSRWAYVFGSGLLLLFGVQVVTGIVMAAHYSPSTTDAWASVNYLQTEVYLGWLLRGLHHFGASAMVIVMVMHILQTLWYGAYRAPREVNWLFGVFLLQIVLAFALTGYLLPWDQKGYWATQVATSIVGTVPLIGSGLKEVVQGGPEYGNFTLTRFYALHVFVLPIGLTLLAVAHVYLFRRHGVTVHPSRAPDEVKKNTQPFAPTQLLKDAAFGLAVFVVVFVLAVVEHGAPLEAPADPSSQYLARPEWYFLPLFQLLKYFEGPFEVVGTILLPGFAMAVLTLLPFLHPVVARRTTKATRVIALAGLASLAVVVGLGVKAVIDDSRSPEIAKMRLAAERAAKESSQLAKLGVPVTGPLELYRNDPVVWGRRVFQQRCEQCHSACDVQPYKGTMCLEGYASRAWLERLLRNPRDPHFFGNTPIDEMDDWSGKDEDLVAVVEFLYSQSGRPDVDPALAERGKGVYAKVGCENCHSLDGKGTELAPDLRGHASEKWLSAFVRSPGGKRFYGDMNEMETFDESELSDEDLKMVVAFLRSQAESGLTVATDAERRVQNTE